MSLLGYIKRPVYVNAKVGRKQGIVCPDCKGGNITAELHLGRIRINECQDCGYSSDEFIELKKQTNLR